MLNNIKFPHISKDNPRYKRYVIDNPIHDRFLAKVSKTKYCWEWVGSKRLQKNPLNNYGQFSINKKIYSAHRVAWTLFKGQIPWEKQVLHKCDNIICVRPSHLYIGTPANNCRDRVRRGRSAIGSKNGRAKLTEEGAKFIKTNISILRPFEMAEKLGVTFNTVWKVIHGYTWNHIKP